VQPTGFAKHAQAGWLGIQSSRAALFITDIRRPQSRL
jgi:hypothetical protein